MVTAATDVQGHASAVITANGNTGTYGVTASATVVAGPAEFVLTNLPGGVSALVFTQQPTNTAAGQAIAPPVTVQVQDGSGHPISTSGVPVELSLFSGTGVLSGTLVQLTDPTGTARCRLPGRLARSVAWVKNRSNHDWPDKGVMCQSDDGRNRDIALPFATSRGFCVTGVLSRRRQLVM
jgi:hypothetical protein